MFKRWVLNRDTCRNSQDCITNSLQGWLLALIPFHSGHMEPPAWDGCRCTLTRAILPIGIRPPPDPGPDLEMAWVTQNDLRVCGICMANQDQGWIPTSEAFRSGHTKPPAHPFCRCSRVIRSRSHPPH